MPKPKTITIRELKCLRCGNKWFPRKTGELPVLCPDCKNPKWNEAREKK